MWWSTALRSHPQVTPLTSNLSLLGVQLMPVSSTVQTMGPQKCSAAQLVAGTDSTAEPRTAETGELLPTWSTLYQCSSFRQGDRLVHLFLEPNISLKSSVHMALLHTRTVVALLCGLYSVLV